MIKDFLWNILYKADMNFVYSKLDLDEKLLEQLEKNKRLEQIIIGLNISIDSLNEIINEQEEENIELIKKQDEEEEAEKYWNNKRPPTIWLYPGRPDPTSKSKNTFVDPRIFFQIDRTLHRVEGTNDEKALAALDWVRKNVPYVSDNGEYWQFAYETARRKKGDCDDHSILIGNILYNSGVPYWRIRLNAGNVKVSNGSGGHAWTTYLREKDNQWYVLDSTYWYAESRNFNKKWKTAEKYLDIWGSWNAKYVFGDLPKIG